jgi:hypothetical protein
VLQKNQVQLSDLERMIQEEAATDTSAFDPVPTKLTIAPGGINVFATSDGETMKTLPCIIVIAQKAKAYWPEKGSGNPPLCSSRDGSNGVFNAEADAQQMQAALTSRTPHPAILLLDAGKPLPDSFPCSSCALAQWGSAHQGGVIGKARACKSLNRMVLIVDGFTQPALLTLPPTSLRNFDAYASGLAQHASAYFAVRTKIALESKKSEAGDPYSVATFSKDSALTDQEQLRAVIALRTQFKALVAGMEIISDDYDTTPTFHGPTPPDDDDLPF